MADCHIGAWRDPKLKDLSMKAFEMAADISIQQKVDFILIAGDLFNTSLPSIEYLKKTTRKLKEIKENNIPVYIIPGSHDFSPSGKTMLDVLEEAGLMINVVRGSVDENKKLRLKFTTHQITGAKITGLLGRRGTLEKNYYEQLDKDSLEKEPGTKIFMFHTALTELKPKNLDKMDSTPISFLPKGFEYYAGGHVHIVKIANMEGYKNIVYPGPLFPANFAELEELKSGGFYIYNHGNVQRVNVEVIKVFTAQIDANHRTPEEVVEMIEQYTKAQDFSGTIVLLRVGGVLKSGRSSDVNFKDIFTKLYSQKAFYVMKNTSKLTSEEFEEIKVSSSTVDEIEDNIIKEHLGQIKTSFKDEEDITRKLMKALSDEKHEGEKVYEYDERVKKEIEKILN